MIAVTLKRWAALCLLPLFAVVAKGETVGIIVTATGLTNSSGGTLPDTSLIQVLANTAGQTPGSPTVSSFVSGADVVLASFGLNSSTTGIAGSFQIYLTVDRSAFAGLNSGTPLLLRWYDIPYAPGQTAPGTAAYGQFTSNVIVDDSTSGWTLGLDGNNASLNFVNVSNGGSQAATSGNTAFTIVPPFPSVTAISSANGPTTGGTLVTLTGTNFTGATAVKFGTTSAANLTVVSATWITVTSPAGSAGTVDVTVITPHGTSATSASDQFTYVTAPVIPLNPVVPVTSPANVAPIRVTIGIDNLVHTYDGTPKSATVTTSPNVSASISYPTSSGAPTNAGSYTVMVNVTDPGYSGSAEATLTIAKAKQALSFAISGGDFNVGSTLSLNATASSGLPVTFSIFSGNASLSASGLTITESGQVTIRATQAGNENYQPIIADQGFTGVFASLRGQTITFAALPNVAMDAGSVALSGVASSGLPVSFTVVSGPAILVGNQLVLSGAAGLVTIQASQAGNATIAAAPNVVRAFAVTQAVPDIFFGELIGDLTVDSLGGQSQSTDSALDARTGNVAAAIFAGTNRGTVLIVSPAQSLNVLVDITVNADGTFVAPFTSAGRSLTLTGKYGGGLLTGQLATLGVTFMTTAVSPSGATANLAGLYESNSVNSATGGTASIVGPDAQILVVADTGTLTAGAVGSVNADGTFNLTGFGSTIFGVVDAPTSSLAVRITVGNQTPVSFTEVSAAATRTDRLINLSSRVRIAHDRLLIMGFVVGGTEPKRILVRGVGPALAGFGVQAALANPRLQLFDATGRMILENDDWSEADTSAAFAQVGAFSLPADSKDAALLATLAPGAYTVQITAGDEAGVALAEIYDASANAGAETQRVVNISTRGTVDAGSDGLLISGFVITGNTPKKVLIRGVGPSLGTFGVSGTLVDPRLTVYNGSTMIAQNDDWSTSLPLNAEHSAATASELAAAAQSVGAFPLGANTKDAALIITLAPGAYTAQVTGVNGSTGAAIVEIYELPH
jgi:hypothetical protein